MTIDVLRIRNYQRIDWLEVRFDPMVTVIIGPTDVGKTSMLAALRWALCNMPSGKAHIRHGSSEVGVWLEIDGHKLARQRGDDNTYRLDGRVFRSFAGGVPDPVAELVGVDPAINFQGQHDPPYWLSMGGGDAARALNAVVDLSLVDQAIKAANARVRKVSADLDAADRRIADYQQEIEALDWVPVADQEYQRMEQLRREAVIAEGLVGDLSRVCRDLTQARRRAGKARQYADDTDDLADAAEALEGKLARRDALQRIVSDARRQQAYLGVPDFSPVEAARAAESQAMDAADRLQRLLRQIRQAASTATEAGLRAAAADLELADNTPDVCPVCGGDL